MCYATFTDETLNQYIRRIAEHAHPLNFTLRLNKSVQLLGFFHFEPKWWGFVIEEAMVRWWPVQDQEACEAGSTEVATSREVKTKATKGQ